MPGTNHTAIRNLPTPIGEDFVSEGPEDFLALAQALDGENAGEVDFLSAGVPSNTSFATIVSMENSATCALSVENCFGVAWLPSEVAGLVRTVTQNSFTPTHLKPESLPAPGKYMNVALALSAATPAWGVGATVSVVSGEQKNTQQHAEEEPATLSSSQYRVRDIIILNTAGVYSIVESFDRRIIALTPPARETIGTFGAASGVATGIISVGRRGLALVRPAKVEGSQGTITFTKPGVLSGMGAVPVLSFILEPGERIQCTTSSGNPYIVLWQSI